MPAIFGLSVANHVILSITGYPHDYLPSKARDKMYDGMLSDLQGREERLARHIDGDESAVGLRLPITGDDVGYVVEEVYRGRSVVSGLTTRLTLCRWRKPDGSFVDRSVPGQKSDTLQLKDLVLMTKDEAVKHEKDVLKGGKKAEEVWPTKVVEAVESRMKEEELYERYR